ncbi:hypothetical protein C1X35_29475 [Pseudomonas sp. FW306-1C-G01A]|nr:hypothetical protein C1X56_29100 [Pseudomonas sp. GW101-1A09]PMV89730.1 hypothetical protein C1X51_24830 [Pseudomonas sp. FW306-2-2C-B10A]PMV92184.1 hypothetical protein C1X55_29285 [Pseudomonas sp. GW460-C8]PMW01338.1 hypothetical protein C1X50_26860 [Pseudomonas sp. MPR-TSA4]PMW07539.1 hypothetical protein C1X52_30115 [Pseudomonas sp. FW306-2-1A-C05A]PMW11322.1 hypothetical protein C1X53_32260 [Pseudomonas sp. GW456-E6]PMW23156.1 hypothetical protein C1X40_06940 [Pseudomonas sp. GW456-11
MQNTKQSDNRLSVRLSNILLSRYRSQKASPERRPEPAHSYRRTRLTVGPSLLAKRPSNPLKIPEPELRSHPHD